MDPRLLKYYNRELQYIREMGGEFAKEFPKIAGRLGLDGFECTDPYVERLLEGFSFLAGRVQLKLDSEFPKFTRNLLEIVYPHYLAPTPSMTVVQLNPDFDQGDLTEGISVQKNSKLVSHIGNDGKTACEYRTAHNVTLWPIELVEAKYIRNVRDLPEINNIDSSKICGAIHLKLHTLLDLTFDKLPLDELTFFLHGNDKIPTLLYEQIFANSMATIVKGKESKWHEVIPQKGLQRVGFEEDEAMLPYGKRSFQGYRLLEEYFAFPERFLFFRLAGLRPAIKRCNKDELDIYILLDSNVPTSETVLKKSHFSLFCTPAINLFKKRADRIHLKENKTEYHVVPDRTRPMDFEVFGINSVVGLGTPTHPKQNFLPFYSFKETMMPGDDEENGYFSIHREPRVLSSKQREYGARSSYVGHETFLSLVDGREGPYDHNLRQLKIETLCTNRDLPLHMPTGKMETDFKIESGAPVKSIKCLAGPTKPKPSSAEGESSWRLISQLSLNYLSLIDNSDKQGAVVLRDLLKLYGDTSEAPIRKQIEGVKSVTSKPVVRQIFPAGQMTYGRGLEVSVTFDEEFFEGTGVIILGAVLEMFFSKYVSINSFTETVIKSLNRGEIIRWPIKVGMRHIL